MQDGRPLVNGVAVLELHAAGQAAVETELESALVCPLSVGDEVIGTIAVYHVEAGCYTEDHRRVLEESAAQDQRRGGRRAALSRGARSRGACCPRSIPGRARRMALRDLGGMTQTTEAVRDVRTIWLDLLWLDLTMPCVRCERHRRSRPWP